MYRVIIRTSYPGFKFYKVKSLIGEEQGVTDLETLREFLISYYVEGSLQQFTGSLNAYLGETEHVLEIKFREKIVL